VTPREKNYRDAWRDYAPVGHQAITVFVLAAPFLRVKMKTAKQDVRG
jgi:hypothetical protein